MMDMLCSGIVRLEELLVNERHILHSVIFRYIEEFDNKGYNFGFNCCTLSVYEARVFSPMEDSDTVRYYDSVNTTLSTNQVNVECRERLKRVKCLALSLFTYLPRTLGSKRVSTYLRTYLS